MIILLRPKRLLKTQFFRKKPIHPMENCLGQPFLLLSYLKKPQGTIYKGSQGTPAITVEVIRSFL